MSQDWIRLPDGSLRRLTLRECAGLQGFPREWQFLGSRAAQFRQVGNAVPVELGHVLGTAVLRTLRDNPAATSPARSRPFPARFKAAIAYTAKEHARNGASRARARQAPATSRKKGLGSADRSQSLPLFDAQDT